MTVNATFVGGPLGGQVRRITFARTYEVPVLLSRPSFHVPVESETFSGPSPTAYGRETYRYEGRNAFDDYLYRWVRPDIEGIQDEIRQLKARIAELTPVDGLALPGWDLL